MAEFSPTVPKESERAEWEAVIAALSRTPRLAKLLLFLGDLYFQNRSDEINEFQLATKVLGRSEKVFDPTRDSIARVEAYRLRKRLKEYYETEGVDHPVVISLPAGSYVPCFLHRPGPAVQPHIRETGEAGTAPALTDASAEDAPARLESPEIQPNQSSRRKLLLAISVAAAVLLAAGLLALRHSDSTGRTTDAGNRSENRAATIPTPATSGRVPIRLLCGYDGTPRIDSAGAYWEADRYYDGGTARSRPEQTITRTSDPMLFEHWRLNDFKYDIPLAPGPYELHLFFVAPDADVAIYSSFDVNMNGRLLLDGINIPDDALGTNVADERVFKDVYPDSDGKLHLKFTAVRSAPSINAIELIPSTLHHQLPIRMVTQRTAVTDSKSNIWHPDNYFQSGHMSDLPQPVTGTSDPKLYAYERYGHFNYSIPVDPHGRYTLVLHFAELYWGADPGIGRRVFRVFCSGSVLLETFDIFKEAGSLHAVTRTFSHLRPSAGGKLDITFEPIENNATISAIEVIDESE